MILQALVDYYEALAAKGEISRPGWAKVKVSFALEISETGELLSIIPLKAPSADGKKMLPREMELPAPTKRTVGISANFLCDNSIYFFGLDSKGKPERAKLCFEAAKALHTSLLSECQSPMAKAICAFFESWEPETARENPLLENCLEELDGGANLVFLLGSEYAQNNSELANAWQNHYNDSDEDGVKMRCLVTGKMALPVATHPSIRGVNGAQSAGAALVSFNAPAYCSFGREQNINAPMSKYAAFAYTTALNLLLSDRKHTKRIGDMTLVYWSEDANPIYQDAISQILDGNDSNTMSDDEMDYFMESMAEGRPDNWDGIPLKPDNRFYILGISPNAARLSVRLFLRDSFGSMVGKIKEHYNRLEIVSNNRSKWKNFPLWALLRETINENARDKSASPQMAGDTLRAILTGGKYPATLYQQTQLRIRAEREITQGRAAIIKAYLMKNTDKEDYKEALKVELNESTTYQPYVLGRLFSILEQIQEKASGVTTIKDKYFSSACATPSTVFPLIMNLADKHLRKLDGGIRVNFSKQLGELTSLITESYPVHHNLYDQGIFQLGYYHQTQKRYEKREKTEITEETKEEN
ncbi:MAG: type I-C CRISPR-associated protein Cas8c/Csd1 [Oscillospiraceae bacterium]